MQILTHYIQLIAKDSSSSTNKNMMNKNKEILECRLSEMET